jgi:hypothetical protein
MKMDTMYFFSTLKDERQKGLFGWLKRNKKKDKAVKFPS